jgi:hypothetical protein
MMKNLLVLFLFLYSWDSLAQSKEDYRKGYVTSYNYIKSTIDLERRIGTLMVACAHLGNPSSGFRTELHVSSDEIPNDINLVLCDYIRKKYDVVESCAQLFGTNAKFIQHVKDSIDIFKKKREELEIYSVADVIPEYLSSDETGYVLFYSKIYDKTLSVELMSFCDSYKEGRNWYGASQIFYFTFTEDWEIEDVFIGKKHYQ